MKPARAVGALSKLDSYGRRENLPYGKQVVDLTW